MSTDTISPLRQRMMLDGKRYLWRDILKNRPAVRIPTRA
jgi:hypothetical protein